LHDDRSLGAAKGAAAAAWAARNFSAEAYVARLLPFLQQVVAVQPLLRAAEGVGRNLAGFGVARTDPLVSRVAREMDQLFLKGSRRVAT